MKKQHEQRFRQEKKTNQVDPNTRSRSLNQTLDGAQ